MLEQHSRVCFRKKYELAKLKPTVKHPYKVHVWGGISKRGPTPLVIFDGIMTAAFYVNVLKKGLISFMAKTFPDGCTFQQDNDPKHRSKLVLEFIRSKNIPYHVTPPESPDLNPIEMVWHELKHHLRKNVKPTNKETLIKGITEFWSKLTADRCTRYIDHIQKVLPLVLVHKGCATGH